MDRLPLPKLEKQVMDGIDVLTDEALWCAVSVRVAFSGRAGGVSAGAYASLNTASHVGDDVACVLENRRLLQKALGFSGAPLIVPNQVHGTHVVHVRDIADAERADEEAQVGADVVAVHAPGVGALLNSADCLPLIIVSPTGRFTVVHAGWRGAVAGIAGKAARTLAEADEAEGACAGDYNAYIGPHIRSECFEVSDDVARQFADRFGADAAPDDRHVSLARAVSIDLMEAGLDGGRIADARLCTVCNARDYYSYRASDGLCGRHAAVAFRASAR